MKQYTVTLTVEYVYYEEAQNKEEAKRMALDDFNNDPPPDFIEPKITIVKGGQ